MARSISEIELVGNPYPVLAPTFASRFLTAQTLSQISRYDKMMTPKI